MVNFYHFFEKKSGNYYIFVIFQVTMVIEWREREHTAMDHATLQDLRTLQELRECGLLKLFCILMMRKHRELLELLISYWDPDNMSCMVDD